MVINFNLIGKTALITGATRGIGNAISDLFLNAGANVILTGTKSDEVKLHINANENPHIQWIKADFSTSAGIQKFLGELKNDPPIDICINNAGINIIKSFDTYSAQEYKRLMNINVNAPFLIMQNLLLAMKKRNYGRVVNIASIWSHISKSKRALYSTSKTGLVGMTRGLAVEYGASNILLNCISPGFTKTELTEQSLSGREIEELSRQIPLNRFANPEEIARVVLFLASDMNTYITGQNLIIDGGFSIV